MRVELAGVGVAIAVGMMLGGALHPNLAGDDRPLGPQMLLGAGATRSAGLGDPGLAMASYHGALPTYVVGTDASKPFATPLPRDAAEISPAVQAEVRRPVAWTRVTYGNPDPPEHDYPSLTGERPYRAASASDAGVDTDDTATADPG